MDWIRKVYIPDNPIKYHITHPDASGLVDDNILKEHDCLPSYETDQDELRIDPGGSMLMNSEPIINTIDELKVSIKPEHIYGANIIWSINAYELSNSTDNDEKVFVVNMDVFNCCAMPESTYIKIGAWLASLSAIGYSSRAEIAASLDGVDNYKVILPEVIGE
jgi:hypothetical protein